MGDDWYELASLDHFWVKHRFKVFNRIFRKIWFSNPTPRVADIGCGHGLLQRQLYDHYRWIIDGYDLNQVALSNSMAAHQPIIFYDINERHSDLRGAYDVIFLFDVIEHLEDEFSFIESVKFHLKPGGLLVVNVPAKPWLFSGYDRVVGHFRRYTEKSMNKMFSRSGFILASSTYWGLAYIPLIMLRKLILRFRQGLTDSEITEAGFKPPAGVFNKFFDLISAVDPIPNHFAGSSLMTIYRYQ
jgi:SAM-dependent methyltransferase